MTFKLIWTSFFVGVAVTSVAQAEENDPLWHCLHSTWSEYAYGGTPEDFSLEKRVTLEIQTDNFFYFMVEQQTRYITDFEAMKGFLLQYERQGWEIEAKDYAVLLEACWEVGKP